MNDHIIARSQHTTVMSQAPKNHKISKQNDIFVLSICHLIFFSPQGSYANFSSIRKIKMRFCPNHLSPKMWL